MERADLIRREGNSDVFELISFDLGSVLVGEGIAYEKLKMGDRIVVFSKDNRSFKAMILIFIVEGARLTSSFCMRSAIPGNMVVPPERTMLP